MTYTMTDNLVNIHTMLRLQVRREHVEDHPDPVWHSQYVLDLGPLGRELMTIKIDFGDNRTPRDSEVWMIEVLQACLIVKTARACWRVS